jgi:hypothetical protein
MSNEKTTDADAGRLELGVRPIAWAHRYSPRGLLHTLRDNQQDSEDDAAIVGGSAHAVALYDQAALDAARMAGVHSVHEQTAVIVRAALDLLEAVEGCDAFPPEKIAAFRRVFGA